MSNTFVVCLGIGVVFIGLVAIIILVSIISAICRAAEKKPESAPTAAVASAPEVINNRQEIIAAVSAAVAEELGADISAIRIHSFKKI